jgi:hypothetical protein
MSSEDTVHLNALMFSTEFAPNKIGKIVNYIKSITPPNISDVEKNVHTVELHVSFTFPLCREIVVDIMPLVVGVEGTIRKCEEFIRMFYFMSVTFLNLFDYYRFHLTLEYGQLEDRILELTDKIQEFQIFIEEYFRDIPLSVVGTGLMNVYLNMAKRDRAKQNAT